MMEKVLNRDQVNNFLQFNLPKLDCYDQQYQVEKVFSLLKGEEFVVIDSSTLTCEDRNYLLEEEYIGSVSFRTENFCVQFEDTNEAMIIARTIDGNVDSGFYLVASLNSNSYKLF